jgi:hypothetical protein
VAAWGSSAGTNVPAGLSNVALVAAGTDFGLAARSDGTLISWGSPPEMGIPTGLTNVVLLAAGANHGMVLRSRASDWEVRLLYPVRTLNTFGASLSTREGSTYILEFSRNLAPDDWSAISTIRGYGYGVLRNISDLAPVDGQRFYRVREER